MQSNQSIYDSLVTTWVRVLYQIKMCVMFQSREFDAAQGTVNLPYILVLIVNNFMLI